MADTPRGGIKRKQQKQTLSPAGATPLVGKDGNDSIKVSDSPPESQEIKRRQKKLEMDLNGEAAGCDPVKGQVVPNMAPDQNKAIKGITGSRSSTPTPPTTETGQIPPEGDNKKGPSIPHVDKGKHCTKQVLEEIMQKSVEEILGTEPSKLKRRQPRLSTDPSTKPRMDDMMTVLLAIRQDNAVLKQDLVKLWTLRCPSSNMS